MKIITSTSSTAVFAAFAAPLVEGFAGGGRWHKKHTGTFLHGPRNNNINKLVDTRNERAAAPLFMSEVVGDPSNVMALSSSSSSSSFYNSDINSMNNTASFAAVDMTSVMAYGDDMLVLATTATTTTTTSLPNEILLDNNNDNSLLLQQEKRVWWNANNNNNILDNILQQPSAAMGRFICLTAAAIYGTNFATVKMLDEVMPLAVSAALRFSLAAVVVTAIVLGQEQKTAAAAAAATQQLQQQQQNKHQLYSIASAVEAEQTEERERWSAMMLGAEVGAWYAVGYLCQAYGLHMVDASKVRTYVWQLGRSTRCALLSSNQHSSYSLFCHYSLPPFPTFPTGTECLFQCACRDCCTIVGRCVQKGHTWGTRTRVHCYGSGRRCLATAGPICFIDFE